MGNCRSSEAVDTVVIEHPGVNAMVERFHSSLSAKEVMSSNPGYYIALVFDSPTPSSNGCSSVKQLKLLRPDDTLHLGHVYRLIPFEDVLTLFATKKSVRLGNLDKESGTIGVDKKKKLGTGGGSPQDNYNPKKMQVDYGVGSGIVGSGSGGDHRQWEPALQSIAEA